MSSQRLDTVTVDLRLSNSNPNLVGIGLWARDYDPAVVQFVEGTAATSVFNEGTLPNGTPYGGFPNYAFSRAGTVAPNLAERPGFTGPIVEFAASIVFPPERISGDGSLDVGVDGIKISDGGVHARMTFEITGPGVTTITFAGEEPNSGVVTYDPDRNVTLFAPVGASVTIPLFESMVVPEPSTALLLGLGLAALAGRRSAREV